MMASRNVLHNCMKADRRELLQKNSIFKTVASKGFLVLVDLTCGFGPGTF
jgi:hypothetical protein